MPTSQVPGVGKPTNQPFLCIFFSCLSPPHGLGILVPQNFRRPFRGLQSYFVGKAFGGGAGRGLSFKSFSAKSRFKWTGHLQHP